MSRRVLIGLCLAAAAQGAHALTPEQLFEKVSASVFVVHVYDKAGKKMASGSGVVIGRDAIVTNCHVLARSSSIRVSRGNASFGATLEYPDPERDLCQLKVRDLSAPAVPLAATGSLKIGQRVYAIGAPLGLELTLSDGLVSSLRGDDGETPIIQTTAPISPGSSGGGLFDADGRLVGITTFGGKTERQLNFAHPADWVRELPERGKANLAKLKEPKTASVAGGAAAASAGLPGMPQIGDSWVYAAFDMRFRPRDPTRKVVHTVRSVSSTSIVESVDGREVLFGDDMLGVMRGHLVEVAPFVLSFRELTPGLQLGAAKIQGMEALKPGFSCIGDKEPFYIEGGEVVGPERITVRAGTFDAILVRFRGRYHAYIDRATTGCWQSNFFKEMTTTVWYAPSVKRAVKTVVKGDGFHEAYELESYSVR